MVKHVNYYELIFDDIKCEIQFGIVWAIVQNCCNVVKKHLL